MLRRTLTPGLWDGRRLYRRGVLIDGHTLRMAASARGLSLGPLAPPQLKEMRQGHSASPARILLQREAGNSANITLAMILRPQNVERAYAMIAPIRHRFADLLFIVDSDRTSAAYDGLQLIAHRLNGDFARQRNAAQRTAQTPWVLQIDDDETLSAMLLDALGWMTAQADRQGLLSLGFPRRNIVDGRLSDHYPDIQYRLNRKEVRYTGIVHERPDLGGRWQDSAIMLAGHIEHHLDGEHVRQRTRTYGAMHPSGARPADERALLKPFRAR